MPLVYLLMRRCSPLGPLGHPSPQPKGAAEVVVLDTPAQKAFNTLGILNAFLDKDSAIRDSRWSRRLMW